jgi:hypothetical protein
VSGNRLTYLRGRELDAPSHVLGGGLPDGGRPAGLLSLEDPESTLCEMAGHGANGNGMALATGDAVVDLTDVLGLPGEVVAVADDDIGRFPGLSGQGQAVKAHLRYWLEGFPAGHRDAVRM